MKIIVARYSENMEWTIPFENVIIYNKGEPIQYPNEIFLPNVGREGHTFYTYIYENYDNLDDYTIFLQGNPFDHSPNIIETLQNLIIRNKTGELNETFILISERIIDCNLTGCKFHYGLPMQDIYEYLFNKRIVDLPFIFGAGAQFLVSKEQILSRPKEFYLKIIKMLDYHSHPIEGFVIERFHPLIFS
jgi:hypothetical protein